MKAIPSLPGYMASTDGDIFGLRARAGIKQPLRTVATPEGYLRVKISRGGKEQWFQVHRLVAEAYHGPCPDGQQCRHLDGDPANNHFSNLAWGTPAQNAEDRKRHGTEYGGPRHHNSAKTECPKGHPLTGDNVRTAKGRRVCVTCKRASDNASYHRRKTQ